MSKGMRWGGMDFKSRERTGRTESARGGEPLAVQRELEALADHQAARVAARLASPPPKERPPARDISWLRGVLDACDD